MMINLVRRLQTVMGQGRDLSAVVGVGPRYHAARWRLFRSLNVWFWVIVGIPTLLSAVYLFGLASDLYVSEAKFIVRGPARAQSLSIVSSLLGGAGMGAGQEDTFAVSDFIMSRDAVRKLQRSDDLTGVLSRPEGDLVSRFPGLMFWRKDFEALYRKYGSFVNVEIDHNSGVVTLEVKAYRPEDAQRIAHSLIQYSEELVNDLNARARDDALATFEKEVAATQQHIAGVQEKLTAYRIKEKMLDPKSASAGPLEVLTKLSGQSAAAKTQLADLLRNSPKSPQIAMLNTRIASLDKAIAEERAKITGDSDSVASAIAEYERLDVQRQLDERALASAIASLESAKLEAQRQQLFLEVIAQANLPDFPLYPKRFLDFATVVASCLLLYGIAWLLIASVREHAAA